MGRLCQGVKKNGESCRGAPQRGHNFCGPHLSQEEEFNSACRKLKAMEREFDRRIEREP